MITTFARISISPATIGVVSCLSAAIACRAIIGIGGGYGTAARFLDSDDSIDRSTRAGGSSFGANARVGGGALERLAFELRALLDIEAHALDRIDTARDGDIDHFADPRDIVEANFDRGCARYSRAAPSGH